MSLVSPSHLINHARDAGYRLPVIEIESLPVMRGALTAAKELDAPLIAAVRGARRISELLPSLEAMARSAPGPVLLLGAEVKDAEEATLAVRNGCNLLSVADRRDEPTVTAISKIAEACGIPLVEMRSGAVVSEEKLDSPPVATRIELEQALSAVSGGPQGLDSGSRLISEIFCITVLSERGAEDDPKKAT